MTRPSLSMAFVVLLLVALFPLQSIAENSEQHTLKQLINIAGSQRMLSQRLVKQYCQIGLGVFTHESVESITRDVERFERQLDILKKASDDPVFQEKLEWVGIAWQRFRPLVTGPVIRDNVLRMNHLAEDLLYTTDQITMILQDSSNNREEMLVNVSGRQRMMAQRLGKLYMLKTWGFDLLSINNEMERLKLVYDDALEQLRTAPESSDEIRASLEEVIVEWIWFRSVLERKNEPAYRLIVSDASDSLLDMMDKITIKFANPEE
jgi:nitrate/nitrite-specific signal transduction histidine kinase